MSINTRVIRRIIAEEVTRILREGDGDEDLMMKFIEAQREIADQFRGLHGDKPDPIDNARQDIYAVVSKVNDEAERVGFDVEEYMEALKSALEDRGVSIEFRIDDYSDRPLTDIEVVSGNSEESDYEDEAEDESELNEMKGMTFRIKSNIPPEILRNLRPGDKIPSEYLEPSRLSPEEGPGARAAMKLREPEILSVGKPRHAPRWDYDEEESEEDLYEARKKSGSVVKKGGKKDSAVSLSTIKKVEKKAKVKKDKLKKESVIDRLSLELDILDEGRRWRRGGGGYNDDYGRSDERSMVLHLMDKYGLSYDEAQQRLIDMYDDMGHDPAYVIDLVYGSDED